MPRWRNLTFGGSGFGVSVFAKTGKQTLSNLVPRCERARAVDDRPTARTGGVTGGGGLASWAYAA
jgi:hypothetical protein